MKVISDRISLSELKQMADEMFGNLVKAVVDIEQEIIALGGELHSDGESMLLKSGSKQKDLWGINLYPELKGDDFIEFDSMINLRPSQGNCSRAIIDPAVTKKIKAIVNKLIEK